MKDWRGNDMFVTRARYKKMKMEKYFKKWKPETDVILVGSSPSLLWYPFGQYIDRFKTVIRVNKCFEEEVKEYTGTKINIWATTNNERWDKKDEDGKVIRYIPITEDTYEVWGRIDKTCDELNDNGTFKEYNNRDNWEKEGEGVCIGLTGPKKDWTSDSLSFKGVGTGLLALNYAIHKYEKITIIGHTFYLESENDLVLNFYNDEETKEHSQNKKDYFNGDEFRLKSLSYLQQWILNDKLLLLNPYELDNLRGIK
tara:strand:+ start:2006 stop:2770 length:765 start_codon:yes stop_codon:yes gene_type:complete